MASATTPSRTGVLNLQAFASDIQLSGNFFRLQVRVAHQHPGVLVTAEERDLDSSPNTIPTHCGLKEENK